MQWGSKAETTVGTDKSNNGKGSHVHREISINHFKGSKKTQGEKYHQSRSTSEIPSEEEAEGQLEGCVCVCVDNFDKSVSETQSWISVHMRR
jgi:hypothetical protein